MKVLSCTGRLFGDAVERTQAAEFRRQAGRDELVEMFGPREIAQPVLAEVAKLRARREMVAHQLLRRQREQGPARHASCGQDARHTVQRLAEVIAITMLGRAGVQRHADFQLADAAPVRPAQRPLGFQRAGQRTRRRVKGHAKGIADRFENVAAAALESLAQHAVVRGQRHAHRVRLLVPFFRAALDVAEQKRNGAGGRDDHDGECAAAAPHLNF